MLEKIGTGKRLAGIVTTVLGLVAMFLKLKYNVTVNLDDPDQVVTAIGVLLGVVGTIHAAMRPPSVDVNSLPSAPKSPGVIGRMGK